MSRVVRTTAGPVAGRLADGVHSWRGIPYATAERFGPAGPVPAWTAPVDATAPGPVGVQPATGGGWVGTEECLTLDVYVPDGGDGPLPVLFWVHGGAFQTGAAADYDGSVLAARGPAVVVAVNYRLGPFGFLQLGTADEPEPSPAMTDLVAALDWVQREIGAFGGDPGRLTLVGQSAGASLVCALLATAAGRDVAAAIAFSVGGPVLEPAEAVDVATRVLAELGLPRTDLAALRGVPADAVAEAGAAVARSSRRQRLGGVVFGPVLDGRVVRAQPIDVIASGALREIPLWFGSCRDEMTMFLQDGADDAAAVARSRVGSAAFDELLAIYRRTARSGEDPLQALLTDEMWVRPAWEMGVAQHAAGGRAWLSRFDHAPSLPPYEQLGPTHGADNACLWARPPRFVERPLLGRPGGPMSEDDRTATSALLDAMLGVVRDGTPGRGVLAGWQPYAAGDRCTAIIAARPVVRTDPDPERGRAWAAAAG